MINLLFKESVDQHIIWDSKAPIVCNDRKVFMYAHDDNLFFNAILMPLSSGENVVLVAKYEDSRFNQMLENCQYNKQNKDNYNILSSEVLTMLKEHNSLQTICKLIKDQEGIVRSDPEQLAYLHESLGKFISDNLGLIDDQHCSFEVRDLPTPVNAETRIDVKEIPVEQDTLQEFSIDDRWGSLYISVMLEKIATSKRWLRCIIEGESFLPGFNHAQEMLDRFGVEEYKSIEDVYASLHESSRMPAFVCQFVQLWQGEVNSFVLLDLFSDVVFHLDEKTGLDDQHLLVLAAEILTQKFGEDEDPEAEMKKVLDSIVNQYDALEALNLEDSELEDAIQHVKEGKPYIEEGPEEAEEFIGYTPEQREGLMDLISNDELKASANLPFHLFMRKASKVAGDLNLPMTSAEHMFVYYIHDDSRKQELVDYMLGQMLFMDRLQIERILEAEPDPAKFLYADWNELIHVTEINSRTIIDHLGEDHTVVKMYQLLTMPESGSQKDYLKLNALKEELLGDDYTPLIDTGLVSHAEIEEYGQHTPELAASRTGLKSLLSLDPELMLTSMSLYWLDPTSDTKFLAEIHPDLTHLREESALSKVYMETLTKFVESGMATSSQMFYYMIIYTYHRLMHELPVSNTLNPRMKAAIEIARHLFKPRKSSKLSPLFKDIELDLSGFQLHSDLGLDCMFDAELKEFNFTHEGKSEVVPLKSVIYLPAQLINKTTELYGKLETMFLIADYFQD